MSDWVWGLLVIRLLEWALGVMVRDQLPTKKRGPLRPSARRTSQLEATRRFGVALTDRSVHQRDWGHAS